MRDKKNPAQPAAESMDSATEQLQRLLSQQPKGVEGDDDVLDNPELEKLFGSLAKGLDQGIDDGALGIPMAEPLTLEALVATLEQPVAAPNIPEVKASPDAVVACHKCGAANSAGTHFCGMCGQGLEVQVPKVSGNGAKLALPEPPKLAPVIGTTRSSLGFKAAFLAGLALVLTGAVYQEQLWRMPMVADLISSLRSARPLPRPPQSPTAQETPASNQQPEARREPVVVGTPNTVVRPSKPSATLIRRGLAEPAQISSAPLPQEIPLPPLPSAAPAAEPAAPPAEKAPAAEKVPAAREESTPQPAKTSQVVPGVLIFKVNPEYPSVARAARVQGAVVMHAAIGVDGTVQQLRLVSGNPLLVNAAMEAVKKWRYRPSTLDGTPVEVETDITISFKGD